MSETSQKSILVVDDEVDLCEILQFDLEDSGFRVFQAFRASDALEILQKQQIDLIVSDIRMPGGDGVYLLGEVRKKHYEHPPVIFVSGFADVTIAEAFHKGIVSFIAKPLSFETLLQAIQHNLKSRKDRWSYLKAPEPQRLYERNLSSLGNAEAEFQVLLGRGGIFLRIEEELPRLNEIVSVSLNLKKEGIRLQGWAACRWIRNANGGKYPRGAGLEWVNLDPATIEFVSYIVDEQERYSFIPME